MQKEVSEKILKFFFLEIFGSVLVKIGFSIGQTSFKYDSILM